MAQGAGWGEKVEQTRQPTGTNRGATLGQTGAKQGLTNPRVGRMAAGEGGWQPPPGFSQGPQEHCPLCRVLQPGSLPRQRLVPPDCHALSCRARSRNLCQGPSPTDLLPTSLPSRANGASFPKTQKQPPLEKSSRSRTTLSLPPNKLPSGLSTTTAPASAHNASRPDPASPSAHNSAPQEPLPLLPREVLWVEEAFSGRLAGLKA